MKKKIEKLYILLTTLILIITRTSIVYARAGGGGGGGGGHSSSSHLSLVEFLFIILIGGFILFLYSIFEKYRIKRSIKIIKKLEESESQCWNISNIYKCIEYTFYTYQTAWSKRNLEKVEIYLEHKYYEKMTRKIDKMIRGKKVNILEDVKLNCRNIISVKNSKNKKYIWVKIEGSMIDYITTEKKINNRKKYMPSSTSFTERWKFVYVDQRWRLSKIKQYHF